MATNNPPKSSCPILVDKIPYLGIAIDSDLGCDEKLITMCNDYDACAAAAAYWRESKSKYAAERCEEYMHLLHDLEMEIIEYVQTRH